jgi:peptidase S41-like protein
MRRQRIALIVLVTGSTLRYALAAPDASAVWIEEFAALRAYMAAHYANLDWMVEHRGLDLPALRRATEGSLRGARTARAARRALADFVDAFSDPHLRIVDSAQASSSSRGGRSGASCAELGYRVRKRSFRFPFESATGWKPAAGSWFPAGSFGDVGVVRIAHFGEDGYLEACDEVGPGHVRERLTEELRRTIAELRARGVRILVVDITGNGGGTEWVDQVTRLLTAKPLHRTAARRTELKCDRTAIWDGARVCPVLGDAGEANMQGEGAWDGPLAVLVDGDTASASEQMVVWLRESRAATILGERTSGAGCGYVDGGAPARLDRIGVTVLMPNCARFTSDGVNEMEGIDPDVALSLSEGRAAERLGRLNAALAAIR